MPARIPEEIRIQQINELPNIEFIKWESFHRNTNSKAIVRCSIDGHEWAASINNLVDGGYGCPKCSKKIRWTERDRISQINGIGGIEFLRWESHYKNAYSKAILRCVVHDYEFKAHSHSLINGGKGCPQCAGRRRWTASEREQQINSISGISFVEWKDGFLNSQSKAVVRCGVDGFEWSATVRDLIHNDSGCPKCSKHGYNKGKAGFLYILRSHCGKHVKVGISNSPKSRLTNLKRETPFGFSLIEMIEFCDGRVAYDLETYLHSKYVSSGFSGFDGATEWLVFDDRIIMDAIIARDYGGLLTLEKV